MTNDPTDREKENPQSNDLLLVIKLKSHILKLKESKQLTELAYNRLNNSGHSAESVGRISEKSIVEAHWEANHLDT